MTETTLGKIPPHLAKYIVDQNYARYTPEDQAAWRFVMRQLRAFLGEHAHPVYLEGLKRTGITTEAIPKISDIDSHLEPLGWGAVPVSGFIPPAAFMEFQSIGVLPIASDMRTVDHLLYTPAPDIVHEAAGHAPILVDPEYTAFLRQYGEVARRALLSQDDVDQYEAIRALSDLKEDPHSTPAAILKAEENLKTVTAGLGAPSEAALLSRMNWWTAEYGMIGSLDKPLLFGAGLLSSVGEARTCLCPTVKKLPLSIACVDYAYDITEKQPQLFVARDFAHLSEVLGQLAARLAFRQGGSEGLKAAARTRTVNTVVLTSGLQVSGALSEILTDTHGQPIYLIFSGPTQLCFADRELDGQGRARHAPGFSMPLGRPRGVDFNTASLGSTLDFDYPSGVRVVGKLKSVTRVDGRVRLVTFSPADVTLGARVLFKADWGEFDLAIGPDVTSVFGGAADREAFGSTDHFVNQRVPARKISADEARRHAWYQRLRQVRVGLTDEKSFTALAGEFVTAWPNEWLTGLELLELSYKLGLDDRARAAIEAKLDPRTITNPHVRACLEDGLKLARVP